MAVRSAAHAAVLLSSAPADRSACWECRVLVAADAGALAVACAERCVVGALAGELDAEQLEQALLLRRSRTRCRRQWEHGEGSAHAAPPLVRQQVAAAAA